MFEKERLAFAKMRHVVETNPDLREDFEQCLADLLSRFATKIRENRFIVGGALEVFVTALLRACGVDARDVGTSDEHIDIQLGEGGGFSVKGHFSQSGDIRLINTLGASGYATWDSATIFVIHNTGLGYADPELLPNKARTVSDAVVINSNVVKNFLYENPGYLVQISVPTPLQDETRSDLVSRVVAREILAKTKVLKDYLH